MVVEEDELALEPDLLVHLHQEVPQVLDVGGPGPSKHTTGGGLGGDEAIQRLVGASLGWDSVLDRLAPPLPYFALVGPHIKAGFVQVEHLLAQEEDLCHLCGEGTPLLAQARSVGLGLDHLGFSFHDLMPLVDVG